MAERNQRFCPPGERAGTEFWSSFLCLREPIAQLWTLANPPSLESPRSPLGPPERARVPERTSAALPLDVPVDVPETSNVRGRGCSMPTGTVSTLPQAVGRTGSSAPLDIPLNHRRRSSPNGAHTLSHGVPLRFWSNEHSDSEDETGEICEGSAQPECNNAQLKVPSPSRTPLQDNTMSLADDWAVHSNGMLFDLEMIDDPMPIPGGIRSWDAPVRLRALSTC